MTKLLLSSVLDDWLKDYQIPDKSEIVQFIFIINPSVES